MFYWSWGVALSLYLGSVMLFISHWGNMLSMLLCIEFMSLCSCIIFCVGKSLSWICFLPVISVFIAIEAALGMTMVVLIVRSGSGVERTDLCNLLKPSA
nr:NADH dehydrogenase subunit 4L [Glottidia pyramidata]